MIRHALTDGKPFENFSTLYLNDRGRFFEPGNDLDGYGDRQEISLERLPHYLKRRIVLPLGVTDVFVWVHGWRNDYSVAIGNARRLFNGIITAYQARTSFYPNLAAFNPGFVAVHWPSVSSPLPSGYKRIRDRTTALTDEGEAEFFLASLLGYLEATNRREGGPGSRTLRAADGFCVHCLGHSFGGRFLTAAIRAAAEPQSPRTLSLLAETGSGMRKTLSAEGASTRFRFTVDSLLVFQMAAPTRGFGLELTRLMMDGPLRGPVVLTYSCYDRANCLWHRLIERGEAGVGCTGAAEPIGDIKRILLGDLDYTYSKSDFDARIVNVDASHLFNKGRLSPEGAHSDFWYEETVHLILSLANRAQT